MGNILGVAGRAVIRRPDGRVLMVRRADGSSTDPGLWELPGGKIGHGESLVDALAREVAEETGFAVEPAEVLHIGHCMVGPFWVTIVTFDCGKTDQEVTLSDEHSDYVWAMEGDLERLPMSSPTTERIQAAASRWAQRAGGSDQTE